ncbi:methylmalonyl-CoA mutase family protein [Aureibacter tunicatorum]|uniref:Methylmalonyl-CoA mutase n=1 Tax=Aureibacter tunicatorum TaxID=866807 RepID=A0AAE4BSZ0_9BACT|nr:methylmalonyl-CoA mutase family protein [Aureibacter tunicatorum]MDR6238917.1 methylmalonyl-CoA mutase [Aureibacter tunicatorum]BDD05156.1 methylmalonyl-CoA mutase small subunit [Aureibacter tunicatorum]
MENSPLTFSEFSPTGKDAWVEKVIADLKGADFNKKLVWKTENGQQIQPFYTKEDLPEEDYTSIIQNSLKTDFASDPSPRQWTNFMKINVESNEQAHAEVHEGLQNSVEAFVFDMKNVISLDFKTVFKGVEIDCISIAFTNVKNPARIAFELLEYADKNGFDLNKLNGFIEADVLKKMTSGAKVSEENIQRLAQAIEMVSKCPNLSCFVISGQEFGDAGANHVQQIAFTLNKIVETIDLLESQEISVEDIIDKVQLITPVGVDYFHEIAKFRALRIAVIDMLSVYSTDINGQNIKITATSSFWSKSIYDPHVNMLRNTTEAMSSVLGGANNLIIDAYDDTFARSDKFSKRISYNISRLLKEESYFDKVADPSGGSYYIENLTKNIIESSLDLFKTIEKHNGFTSAYEKGIISELISHVREDKYAKYSSRRTTIVGTNRYPNNNESVQPTDPKENLGLGKHRASAVFDKLRQNTERYVLNGNKRPKVLLSLYGHPAMRKARSTFSGDFFGTAGFEIEEKYFNSALEAATASANSDASIVVICGSDQDYANEGVNYLETFKAINNNKLLVLAGNPVDILDTLKSAGLDGNIHVKTNAINELTEIQRKLGVIQ